MKIQRTKGKLNSQHKLKDIYKFYCERTEKPVDYKTYRKICKSLNAKIMNKIMTENFIFIMPARTGNLSVRKYKNKIKEVLLSNGQKALSAPVDWKATKDLWKIDNDAREKKKVIYITNEHTEGYKFKFVWNTINANFKNKYFSAFKPLRKHSRELAKQILNNPNFEAFELIR